MIRNLAAIAAVAVVLTGCPSTDGDDRATEAPSTTQPPATTAPTTTTEPPPTTEAVSEPAEDEDADIAPATPNGLVSSNCTGTSATDYRCDLDPLPSGAELDSDCPYGLEYPSSVPDSIRYSSFGLWQTADGNEFMNMCSSSAAWDAAAETGFDPDWTSSAGIGNDDSASASSATLSYTSPIIDGLLVELDRELAELFTTGSFGPEGLVSGFTGSPSAPQSTTITLIWFVGLNSSEPISGTAAFNYTGPDGQNETVIIPFTPENVAQYPGGLRDRYPDARNVAG